MRGFFQGNAFGRTPRPFRLTAECSNQRYHSGRKKCGFFTSRTKKVNEGIFPQECLWQNPRPFCLTAECSNQRYNSGKKNAASSQAAQKKGE
jgi:hypothetical protein